MKIVDGVFVHFIPTTKYKTNKILFRMTAPLEKQTIAKRALVSQMLATANQVYPTVQAFKECLAKLYGTQLSTRVSRKGLTHSVDIELSYLRKSFLPKEADLFTDVLTFLHNCLYKPLSRVAQYQTKVFDIEKKNLISYLEADKEDTYFYSEMKGRSIYYVNESLQIPKYGTPELVEVETSFTAYQEFQKMMKEDRIDIFLVGDFDDYRVLQELHRLPLEARKPKLEFEYRQDYVNVVKERIEQSQSYQSILQLSYQIPCQYGDRDYYALIVFNAMFGEFAHSVLFTHIREQLGLAYSISSQFDISNGLLEVYAGIDKERRDETMRGINRELNFIKLGRFSSDLVAQSKKILQMNALLSRDNSSYLVEQSFNQEIYGQRNLTLDEWLEKIDKVTKADVCRLARCIKLQSLFFLEGVSKDV